jgi:ubiquinone/menaquinone biosynthesis C-methylase UbiE
MTNAMPGKIADRLVWAVEMLEISPSDRLLEIGCGSGVAVSLICERLRSGRMVAIDRSAAMIRLASKRNRAHLASGKVAFQVASLEEAEFGEQRFNKVFAVNVGLFSQQPTRELEILRGLLTPGGRVFLFNQPPTAGKARVLAERMAEALRGGGFFIQQVLLEEMRPAPTACVVAMRGR